MVFSLGTVWGCSTQAPSDLPDDAAKDTANAGVDGGSGDEDGDEVPAEHAGQEGEDTEEAGVGDDGGRDDGEEGEDDSLEAGSDAGEDEPGDGDEDEPGDGDACPYECMGQWRCESSQGVIWDDYTCEQGVCCEVESVDTAEPGGGDDLDSDNLPKCTFDCMGKTRCEEGGGVIRKEMSCEHGVCCEIGDPSTDPQDDGDKDTGSGGGHDADTDAEPCPYECLGTFRCESSKGRVFDQYACEKGVCCLVEETK